MPALTTARDLRANRGQLTQQARALLDRAQQENRDLTAEEQTTFDTLHVEMEALRARYERIETQEAAERDLATI